MRIHGILAATILTSSITLAHAQNNATRAIQMAERPDVSPDGTRIAFQWKGDIWTAKITGGRARRLTHDPTPDSGPVFSPNGSTIAFTSERDGPRQVYTMPANGGLPTRLTWHSEGSTVLEYYPNGKSLLIRGSRDEAGRRPYRFFRISATERGPETLLFDANGLEASISPDGKRLLFTREGVEVYRRGYVGSQAAQIWLATGLETQDPIFKQIAAPENGARSPRWAPDGKSFIHIAVAGDPAVRTLHTRQLDKDTSVALPSVPAKLGGFPALRPKISRDGKVAVFQNGFYLYRQDLTQPDAEPKKIPLRVGDDAAADEEDLRRILSRASNISFSSDGLEVAFIAGGDLWVMDTVLREPMRITDTAEEENEPIFAPDNSGVFFIRDSGSTVDIFKAEATNPDRYLWQSEDFKITKITDSKDNKFNLSLVPTGKKIAFVRGLGDLWITNLDGSEPELLVESWNAPDYDFTKDGKWVAYSVSDNNFNSDVWLKPVDGSREPYNLSRHPDHDGSPKFSPDGKILAFTGRRIEDETDIYYVWLDKKNDQTGKRERTLAEAISKMKKERKSAPKKPEPTPAKKPEDKEEEKKNETTDKKDGDKTEPPKPAEKTPPAKPAPAAAKKSEPKPPKEIKIDFDRLYERIHRISIPESTERSLFWAPDSKRLAFSAKINGSSGTYYVTFPDKLNPGKLTSQQGSFARWDTKNDTIYWLVNGVPGTLSKGKTVTYKFTVQQTLDPVAHQREGFEQAWRVMRDRWYDGNLNNLNWNNIRKKYVSAAAKAPDPTAFENICDMMLGELNGSHTGFSSSRRPPAAKIPWREETAHLGTKFDRAHKGAGWKIASILPDSPAARETSRLEEGDVILSVDGEEVWPDSDLTQYLNGPINRDIRLLIADEIGDLREVIIRPITYGSARNLAQTTRIEATRDLIETSSDGRLGYLNVSRMMWNEFLRFEEEIYARGAGKDGLVIDVRDNGGGFTTDHLLTVLTPPVHAITVPRGGGPGYPQDRRVYATWSKPIIVLCNQNSFSNAEIFSHAIKSLGRGKLVGVPTAGGVISTGSVGISDLGSMRLPFRGWYKSNDGEDMELNGAVPDFIIWPQPGELSSGKDSQVEKAIEVLMEEVKAEKAPSEPKKASDR